MIKKCLNDSVEFEAKRVSAKFCSVNCRKAYARKNGINESNGEILERDGLKPRYESVTKPAEMVQVIDWREYEDPNSPHYIENPFERPGDPDYDREANIAAFQKMGLDPTQWVTTGIKDFDSLTRIPLGRITQIQGPYGVGKTTLCLNMVRGLSRAKKKVLYIDSEASLNSELLGDLGVDKKYFTLYNESSYFEDISEVIRAAAKSGEYEVVIFDSLAMTTTKTIAESDITASNIGQKAKLTHKLISLVQMDFKNTNTAFVVINQEREVIGSYVPQKYTPGGSAVPYAASLIVALKTIKSWRFPKNPTDGVFKGQEVQATIIKSKVNQPWRTQKFKLFYPKPVVQEMTNEDEF